jgi:hypothetical protein
MHDRALRSTCKDIDAATTFFRVGRKGSNQATCAAHGQPPPSAERRVDKVVATPLKTVCARNQIGNFG